ncbi:MAG: hypothetical protein Q4C47_05235, partial [Planctomycetia bacterium]|nr:hypothetical protein [Planctomycetia bacterium]
MKEQGEKERTKGWVRVTPGNDLNRGSSHLFPGMELIQDRYREQTDVAGKPGWIGGGMSENGASKSVTPERIVRKDAPGRSRLPNHHRPIFTADARPQSSSYQVQLQFPDPGELTRS